MRLPSAQASQFGKLRIRLTFHAYTLMPSRFIQLNTTCVTCEPWNKIQIMLRVCSFRAGGTQIIRVVMSSKFLKENNVEQVPKAWHSFILASLILFIMLGW